MPFHLSVIISFLQLPHLIMTTPCETPVTRIACFRFHPNVTAEQKGGRTRAFLDLYALNPALLVAQPIGGRPLNTSLNLTNVKRDAVWDTGFVVVFKVSLNKEQRRGRPVVTNNRATMRERNLISILHMIS
jgi:hypothetical protein